MIVREAEHFEFNEAFFPVGEQPIYCDVRGRHRVIPGYKAIIDEERGNTLSVVSDKYKLVYNADAFKMADYVIRVIFEGKTLQDFYCYNMLMPQTRGHCRMDLILPNNFNRLFGKKNESWTPFVRISNSYNKTVALRYEVGFCRWICKNGVIFGQKGVDFSINHSGRINYDDINMLVESAKRRIGSIGSLWDFFEDRMKLLQGIEIPLTSALGIYCKVFNMHVNKEEISQLQKERLALRAKQIVKASKDYFSEQGNNAYAMLNVLTDFASFPAWTNSRANYVDGYQRRAGKWVDEFISLHKKSVFSLDSYIGDEYLKAAEYMMTLVDMN